MILSMVFCVPIHASRTIGIANVQRAEMRRVR